MMLRAVNTLWKEKVFSLSNRLKQFTGKKPSNMKRLSSSINFNSY